MWQIEEKNFPSSGCYRTALPSLLVKMYKPRVFFEVRTESALHHTNARRTCERVLDSYITGRQHAYQSLLMKKLPLIWFFDAIPNECIGEQLESLLSQIIFGCCPERKWIDTRSMGIRIEIVRQAYVYGYS